MKRTMFALTFFSLTLPAFGQGVDPIIGTWKLNLEKSTYIGQTPPKSQTLTFAGEGQTLTDIAEGVDAQGQAYTIVFRHIYDGMPHPTTGIPTYDSTIYTRIKNTINAVRFRQGKTVEVGQVVIVPGKSLTNTAEGIDENSNSYHYVQVYDKK